MNYRCIIENDEEKQLANIQFAIGVKELSIMNDNIAIQMMDQFLSIVAKYNQIEPRDCNTNLYKEQWIEGI